MRRKTILESISGASLDCRHAKGRWLTMTMKAKRNLKTVAWIAMLVAVIAIAGIEPALAQGR